MFRIQLKKFCEETTLHGVKYIAENRRNRSEKIFWFIALVISIVFTSALIFTLVGKYLKNPIVIEIDENQITNELSQGEIGVENLTLNELKYMQVISLVSRDGFLSKFNVSVATDNFIEKLYEFPSFWHVDEDIPPLSESGFGNWSKEHTANFTEILCPTGLCATFNFPSSLKFFNIDQIADVFNYSNVIVLSQRISTEMQQIEYPVKMPRKNLGLEANIMQIQYRPEGEVDLFADTHPQEVYDGLLLIFHDPFEGPSVQSTRFRTMSRTTRNFYVTPMMTEIDESLIEFAPEERNCYLTNERNLEFFKIYNKVNCDHECLASKTLKYCGCVQFFMARRQSTRICGVADEVCFRRVEDSFQKNKFDCKCFETCRKIKYDIEVYNLGFTYFDPELTSEFKVNFKIDRFLPFKRKVQFSRLEITAYVGGLLGLFAGFSLVSLLELIIFFGVQPLLQNIRRNEVRPLHSTLGNTIQSVPNKLFTYILQYLQLSTLKSFNYMATHKSLFVKFMWLVITIFLLTEIAKTTSKLYGKLRSDMIAISVDGRSIGINEIPFPAITFVSDFQPNFSLLSMLHLEYIFLIILDGVKPNVTFKEIVFEAFNELEYVVHHTVCNDKGQYDMDSFNYNYNSNSEVVDFLRNITSREKWWMLRNVTWNGREDPIFDEVVTRQGIGYAFNMIDSQNLLNFDVVSEDFMFISNTSTATSKPKPWSATADDNGGFVITLQYNQFLEEGSRICESNRFVIHSPFELPIVAEGFKFGYEVSLDVILSVNVIKSDKDVRSISVHERKCYFEDERKLKFFKVYTKVNCEKECLSFITYENCNCVPFYYIRNHTMTNCDVPGTECAWRFYNIDYEKYSDLFKSQGICNCLPTCDVISYDFEMRATKYSREYMNNSFDETTINFKFKDRELYPLRRYRQFTFQDFMSNSGGLMGLLAGASFLSIVEFIYFFTLRLISSWIQPSRKI